MRDRAMVVVTGVMAVTLTAAGLATSCSDSPTAPTPVIYTAVLNAANERQANPVTSTATGSATLTLRGNDSLDFVVMATGLTGAASLSHIHVGSTAVSGSVVNGFVIFGGVSNGTVAAGTVVLSKLVPSANQISGDSLRIILNNGNAYVNVHTGTWPQGEVRGQVVRQ